MSNRLCPKCGLPLKEVRYPSDSYFNRDQWESQRAGDWYCDKCPSEVARSGYSYFWEADFKNKPEPDLATWKSRAEKAEALVLALQENCRKYQKQIPGCSKPGCGYPDGKPCIGCGRIVESEKDQPLKVEVERGLLIVSVGVETLKYCHNRSETEACPGFGSGFLVSDAEGFARDIKAEMCHEEEDGTTPIHSLIDDMIQKAADNGSIHLQEIEDKGDDE
jgi:hypothetical protein